MPSNKDILTRGQKYFDKKSKKKEVAEVKFDASDRLEYLTGFHKRKVHRQKVAKDFHEKQAVKERLEERQRIRDERKQMVKERLELLKKNQEADDSSDDSDEEVKDNKDKVEKVNGKDKKLAEETEKSDAEDDDEWKGFNDSRGILKRKVVYGETEDSSTTVTIESIGSEETIDLYQVAKLNNVELSKAEEVLSESVDKAKKYALLTGAEPVKKKPKKKFRYLTKNERKQNVRKERSKRFKKE